VPAVQADALFSVGTLRFARPAIQADVQHRAKRFSETLRAPPEVEIYAGAMADMFCAYLAVTENR
jgi:hypothetical protein